MEPQEFLHALDETRVTGAISEAERMTSGEIRVFISEKEVTDNVIERAARRFEKLGMTATRERNAVLLYFAPKSQKFAVIGDTGIHQRCGQAFWEEVVAEMRTLLREQRFTDAVAGAVTKVGEVLAREFPIRPDDRNELPNRVERE